MSSVTWFGLNEGAGKADREELGNRVKYSYLFGREGDHRTDNELFRSGGCRVEFNGPASVSFDAWEAKNYEPPQKILLLNVTGAVVALDTKQLNGRSNFSLGDHFIVPVNLKAQEKLMGFVESSRGLPPDQHRNVIDVLRRPSIELRLRRLEGLAGGNRASAKTGVSLKKWQIAAAALVCVLIGGAGGYFVPKLIPPTDHRNEAGAVPLSGDGKDKTDPGSAASAPQFGPASEKERGNIAALVKAMRENPSWEKLTAGLDPWLTTSKAPTGADVQKLMPVLLEVDYSYAQPKRDKTKELIARWCHLKIGNACEMEEAEKAKYALPDVITQYDDVREEDAIAKRLEALTAFLETSTGPLPPKSVDQ